MSFTLVYGFIYVVRTSNATLVTPRKKKDKSVVWCKTRKEFFFSITMPLTRTPPDDAVGESNQQLLEQNQELQRRLDEIQQQLADQRSAQQSTMQQQQNNGTSAQTDGEMSMLSRIKVPPFWKENPTIWFNQIETAFDLYHITGDTTKFRHVVLQLDQTVMPYVSDLVVTPPDKNKYQTLKDRIVMSFVETTELKLRRLLRGIDCQDDKSSAILQKIKNLSEGQCSDSILRTLFLEQLPDEIRGIVSINEQTNLSKLAQQAEKILEYSRPNFNSAYSITNTTKNAHIQEDNPSIASISSLEAKLDALAREFEKFRKETNTVHRTRSQSRGRSQSRNQNSNVSDLCYFHQKFGDDAFKCRPPCSKSQKQQK